MTESCHTWMFTTEMERTVTPRYSLEHCSLQQCCSWLSKNSTRNVISPIGTTPTEWGDGSATKIAKNTKSFCNINHPAYSTGTAEFMLRQNESRAFLRKYLSDPRVFWRHNRREMMAIAGNIPVDKWLAKIKQRSDVRCRLCKRARLIDLLLLLETVV